MKRALLLSNPTAGQSEHSPILASLVARARTAGVELVAEEPASREAMAARAGRAAGEAWDAVFAFGGDGTYATVAEGLAGTRMPLGPVPGGTVNVLVRELGLPLDPTAAVGALCVATPRPYDVGRAGGRLFLLMVSAGIDAETMRDVPAAWKRAFGRGAIGATALGAFLRRRRPAVSVEVDGERLTGGWAIVANARLYGGSFEIADADPGDGLLDVVVFTGLRRRDQLRYAASIPGKRHLALEDVTVRRGTRVVLESAANGECAVQVDGDFCTDGRVEVTLEPGALRVLAP